MSPSTQSSPVIEEISFPSEFLENENPWKVIVWNDPINLMSYVTWVLQKLFGYSREKADKLMMEVHTTGKAVVSSGDREKAELDAYRLHEYGLWATIEQD
ncbi:MAG: ATP-dependent Clp protease adapter ClpS [Actinobacteria bacterium]|jgi:ATP-dependent Clp protease adaptor protein ClpS|nr:ATP-dependent Clp protease adapter ClpS [Actinomycetota bacterium]